MTKRERIMTGAGLSGGTSAPRRNQIKQALIDPGRMGRPGPKREFPRGKPPSQRPLNTIAPLPGSTQEQHPFLPRPQGSRVGQGNQAALGQQLTNRVNNGRISQEQAQKTAQQRQTLKAAFGSDWRSQVFGNGGAKGLEGQTFGRPAVAARRSQALSRARRKLQGGVGPGMTA